MAETSSKSARNLVGKVFLAVWGLTVSVLLTMLISQHLAPFAAAPANTKTLGFIARMTGAVNRWQMLHIVVDDCACSTDVIEHLLARKREPRLDAEALVLVGHRPDLGARFAQAGFAYSELPATDVVAETGIEAGPTLVVVDDAGVIRYSGGYYARRERTENLDGAVLRDLMAGREVAALPVFGCAFSKRLQAASDPLGLKYTPSGDANANVGDRL